MKNYCDEHENLTEQVADIHEMVRNIQDKLFGLNGNEGLFEITRRQESRWKIVTRTLWLVGATIIGILVKMLSGLTGGHQ